MIGLFQVLEVYEGREYQGKRPMIAQVLDQTGAGRKAMFDVTLHEEGWRNVETLKGEVVVLEYTEINGRGANGSYTLRVDGRIAPPSVLEQISKASLAFA